MNITVLLPFFWREEQDIDEVRRLLYRALDSVLDQSYPGEFEILIIDDGSEIPAEQVLEGSSYNQLEQVRVHKHYRNYGLVHALNTGLVQARYEFIARMDADDSWLPGKIEKQVALYEQDSELSIVATGMRILSDPPEDHIRPGSWSGILDFFVEVGCPFPHGSVLARKDVYIALAGYTHDPGFRHCEDYELWGRWVRFFKPAMVEEILFDYSWHPESVSNRFAIEQAARSRDVCARMLENPERRQIPRHMEELTACLDTTLLDTGFMVHAMWKYMPTVAVPVDALPLLRKLMYDRSIVALDERDHAAVKSCYDLIEGRVPPAGIADKSIVVSVAA